MYDVALAAIEAAPNISAEEYRAARRMLDLAKDQAGHLYLTRDDACTLFQVSWPSVLRMLKHLAEAGICEYHSNNRAYVLFPQYGSPLDRAPHARERAPHARQDTQQEDKSRTTCAPARTTCAQEEPQEDHENADRAPHARQRAPHARGRARGARTNSQSVSQSYPTDPQGDRLTDRQTVPKPAKNDRPSPEERQRSEQLLTDPDVGLDPATASQFAEVHRFDYLLRQVFTYRRQLADGRVDGPGALINRIRRRYGATITDADRASPLWQRHMPHETRDQISGTTEEDRRRKYIPDDLADIILG